MGAESTELELQLSFHLSHINEGPIGVVILGPIEKNKQAVISVCNKLSLDYQVVNADKLPDSDKFTEHCRSANKNKKFISPAQSLLSCCGINSTPSVIILANIQLAQGQRGQIVKSLLLNNHNDEDAEALKRICAFVMLGQGDISPDISECTSAVIDSN